MAEVADVVGEPIVDRVEVTRQLSGLGVPETLVSLAAENLPERALGLLLYGSYARREATAASDLDLLVLSSRRVPPAQSARLSLNTYSPDELVAGAGSLFTYHLHRDGLVLHGAPALAVVLARAFEPNPAQLLPRIRRLGALLEIDDDVVAANIVGMLRVAKYLLRSALYTKAIADGTPCFSLHELAKREGEPRLAALLSSHADASSPPSLDLFLEIRSRLTCTVGDLPSPPGDSLESIVVNSWEADRDLSRLALLALGGDVDVPYDLLGRVIL